jgi:hypothetical protein
MAIDILNLVPTSISRDLKSKYILIYSLPKVGKTTFASQFDNNLMLAFEKGYNAISGIYVVDIPDWKTFKLILRQLKSPEAQKRYDSITFDTIGIAWSLCERYICGREGVDDLSEIAWGRGYAMCTKEFEDSIREITLLGYGIVFISHSEEKPIKVGSDETEIRPAIPKRAYEIVNRVVDIIAYIDVDFEKETGISTRTLYTRRTKDIVAGSRFRYLPTRIPFGYTELVDALVTAIEEEGKQGGNITNEAKSHYIEQLEEDISFTQLMETARALWFKARDKMLTTEVETIIEKHFHKKMKLSEAVENQKEILSEVVTDMEDLLK